MRRKSDEIETLREQLAAAQARVAALEAEHAAARRTDPVTGVRTLATFREAARLELERARRSGAQVSLVLYDVDAFRALNAAHGAAAGDRALRSLAETLSSSVRGHDLVGRAGSDELAMLLPETPLEGAVAAAERTVAAMEAADLGASGPVTVSAGAVAAERGDTIDGLLATAAKSLDVARAAGGDRVVAPGGQPGAPPEPNVHQDVIDALGQALTERDKYTAEHSESVVGWSESVAKTLGLDELAISRVSTAALLHDIGKVAIPDSILHKPAKLTDEEWVLMKEHPVIGERILRAIPGLGGVARIVRHEHERWDGGGYPDGLRGNDIPIGSRIILACDTFHAMTSDRPYRARMPHAAAVEELARCAGTQFDPDVTEALIGRLWADKQAGVSHA